MRYNEQSQKIIKNVLEYFQHESECYKHSKTLPVPLTSIYERAARAMKVSLATLNRLQNGNGKCDSDYSKNMQVKVKAAKLKKNKTILNNVRDTIYKMYLSKEHVTIETLHCRLKEELEDDFPYSRSTLTRWLPDIGFKWVKGDNRKFLVEQPSIQFKRTSFLRQYVTNLRSSTPLQAVFIDETWIFSKGAKRNMWTDGSINSSLKKNGDGYRYIIVHAGCKDGFIPNASLIFKAGKKTGDYHDNMNRENYENWFKTQLIPNLKKPSLIIMDNASYHSGLEQAIPTKSWTKRKLISWLEEKKIEYPSTALKDVIWKITSCSLPDKIYHLDKYVENFGHKILRLPPYHCQYNPIEMVWSESKRRFDSEILKTKYTDNDVLGTWSNALQEVTPIKWANYVRHTEKLIGDAWNVAKQWDAADIEPIIIAISNNDDDSSDDSDVGDEDDNEFQS